MMLPLLFLLSYTNNFRVIAKNIFCCNNKPPNYITNDTKKSPLLVCDPSIIYIMIVKIINELLIWRMEGKRNQFMFFESSYDNLNN